MIVVEKKIKIGTMNVVEITGNIKGNKMFATKFMDHGMYARKVKKMSDSELLFTIKDCKEVLKAWPNHQNEGYYMDEIHYCYGEIKRRQK